MQIILFRLAENLFKNYLIIFIFIQVNYYQIYKIFVNFHDISIYKLIVPPI